MSLLILFILIRLELLFLFFVNPRLFFIGSFSRFLFSFFFFLFFLTCLAAFVVGVVGVVNGTGSFPRGRQNPSATTSTEVSHPHRHILLYITVYRTISYQFCHATIGR